MSGRAAAPFDELMAGVTAIVKKPPDAAIRGAFQQYLELFLHWNKTHRMTALSPSGVIRDLFLDSLLFLPVMPPRPLSAVDIGAGAGIPGLPLRLVDPGITLTLVESRRKRVSFLRAVQRELALDNVRVREGRAEELVEQSDDLAGTFDVALARAVGAAAPLRPVAFKYLRIGGVFLVSGPPNPTRPSGFDVIQVPGQHGRSKRSFLRALKES